MILPQEFGRIGVGAEEGRLGGGSPAFKEGSSLLDPDAIAVGGKSSPSAPRPLPLLGGISPPVGGDGYIPRSGRNLGTHRGDAFRLRLRQDWPVSVTITIPPDLRPADGRFGSGPAKVRPEAVAALFDAAPGYLGTSHRRRGVKSKVARLKEGLATLFSLPEGYEVVLGNGGSTMFWDALAFGLIERRSQHLVFGEFSAKWAAAAAAPHLDPPEIIEAEPGSRPDPRSSDVDLYALTHNETSTGVWSPVARPSPDGLVAVDATSAAGGMSIEAGAFDVYYFAPQKCFSSDGGLWIALMSPAALERLQQIKAGGRYIPPSLDLTLAWENSRRDQTYNTPALATVFLMVEQLEWILDSGGLSWAVGRSKTSSDILYSWAETSHYATPFVKNPHHRSPVVVTIDFDDRLDAIELAKSLRANGIVDTEPYRKLGRNQLRIGCYPSIEPGDVDALTHCIDFVVDALAE
jgi:phosphoserine aminotransferase